MAWPAGRTTKTSDIPAHHEVRRGAEEHRVGLCRDQVLLEEELDAVGEPLEEAAARPTRFGPMRLWMRPATRRSNQEKMPPEMAAKVNMTMPARNRATA